MSEAHALGIFLCCYYYDLSCLNKVVRRFCVAGCHLSRMSSLFAAQVQEPEKQEFSESIDTYDDRLTFSDLNITRPLMKVSIFSAVRSLHIYCSLCCFCAIKQPCASRGAKLRREAVDF